MKNKACPIIETSTPCNPHPNQTITRKKIPRPLLALLLMSGLLLAWAGNSLAAVITLDGGLGGPEFNISAVNPNTGDTIIVKGGAILAIDASKTIARLEIGDASSPGKVIFPEGGTAMTLTIAGASGVDADVVFSSGQPNVLQVSTDPFAPNHIIKVKRNFLSGGTGTWSAGNGTVDYYLNGAQTITALTYKNLVLSTDGSTSGTAQKKKFNTGVRVAGVLTIKERAVGDSASADGAVIYLATGSLVYNGSIDQTTSKGEWTTANVMAFPVTINMASSSRSVILDASKSISAQLTMTSGYLKTDLGKDLTTTGTVDNNTKHWGAGKILAGTASGVLLKGSGSYGNVLLDGGFNVTLDGSNPGTLAKIAGRLTINSGKLNIPNASPAKNFTVSLLTYEGADRAANTYGSMGTTAAIQDDDVFVNGGATPKGILTVVAKAPGVIVFDTSFPKDQSIVYGDASITIKGRVDPGTSASPYLVPFADYGNGAKPGDKMWLAINPPTGFTQVIPTAAVTLDGDLKFTATFNTTELPSCFRAYYPAGAPFPPREPADQFQNWPNHLTEYKPFPITITYDLTTPTTPEPNLATGTAQGSLMVNRYYIVAKPTITTKTYGDPDPKVQACTSTSMSMEFGFFAENGDSIPFGTLPNGDTCRGVIDRVDGENVGGYAYLIGNPNDTDAFNLSLDYDMWFNPAGNTFTICVKPITITPDANQQKVYGTLPDPVLNFTYTPALATWDTLAGVKTGSLTRVGAGLYPSDASGERVDAYEILKGTLSFGPNYKLIFVHGVNFNITPLQVTVTGRSGSKVYGELDSCSTPDVTAGVAEIKRTSDGFVYVGTGGIGLPFGDTTTGSPLRQGDNNVGTKNVVQDDWNLVPADCYNIVWQNGTFTINKRPVTMIAKATSWYYGDDIITAELYDIEAQSGICATARGKLSTESLVPTVNGVPGSCALPGNFTISLSVGSSWNNYNVTFSPQTAPLTIKKALMIISADNKCKVSPCDDCDPVTFTYHTQVFKNGAWVAGFSCLADTAVNSFPPHGLIDYKSDFVGNAVTAITPGVYEIRPYIIGMPAVPNESPKYSITFVPGFLTITPKVFANGNKTVGDTVWGSTYHDGCSIAGEPSLAWFVNDPGNNSVGTAGGNPGWSVRTINGNLTINANTDCKFRLDLVTEPVGSSHAGRMAMFDPTRPYKWLIVHATGGILNFAPAKIAINYIGSPLLPSDAINFNLECQECCQGLFQNPVFEGRFDVRVEANPSGGADMYLYFTPVGPTGGINLAADPPPIYPVRDGYVNDGAVGPLGDHTTLLGDTIFNTEVPTLYLLAGSGGKQVITPQDPVQIQLNVANLGATDIYGVQAYLNFSSRYFGTGLEGTPDAPQVGVGTGPWTEPIVKIWNVGGDMDIVMGIALGSTSVGTHDDLTVASIILTPKRTATGTSRVVFRHDGDPSILPGDTGSPASGPALETLLIRAPGQTAIRPARIMSDEIQIINDGNGPVFDEVAAKQVQPYSDGTKALPEEVDVKDPPVGKTTVRTFAGIPIPGLVNQYLPGTASGQVVITLKAHDSGVGLAAAPTLSLKKGADVVNLTTTDTVVPGSTDVQTFVYRWTVPVGADGTWKATVSVSDTITPGVPPHTTTIDDYFRLVVNTYQITGVVEVQNFLGAMREVGFKASDNSAILWSNILNLKFTAGPILDAGAWQDRATVVARLTSPNDTFHTWLRYGSFPNLFGVVKRLRLEWPFEHKNVDAYINGLLYGYITDLPTLANRLAHPVSRIEQLAQLKLSNPTVVTLAAYLGALPTPPPWLAARLEAFILDDFNKMVMPPKALWDGNPTYLFEGVTLSPATLTWLGTGNVAMQNRSLLHDSFAQYVPGMLNPAAASALTDYANAAPVTLPIEAALVDKLLRAFDDLTLNVFSAPDPAGRSTMWPANQTAFPGLYDQFTFVDVPLGADTYAQLQGPALSGPDLTQLNQNLLRDAYSVYNPGPPVVVTYMYEEAKLRPDTVASGFAANKLQRDLNKVIYGPSIWDNGTAAPYNSKRFAAYNNVIVTKPELAALIALSPGAGTADCVRLNRLLLELGFNKGGFNKVLSSGVLAPYVLINVPSATKQLSAKTAWNLRETLAGLAFGVTLDLTAYFVNDGVPGWSDATDHFLRGGDIDGSVGDPVGDDVISLWDYNVLRLGVGHINEALADINGDGFADRLGDYNLLYSNWNKKGDAEILAP